VSVGGSKSEWARAGGVEMARGRNWGGRWMPGIPGLRGGDICPGAGGVGVAEGKRQAGKGAAKFSLK